MENETEEKIQKGAPARKPAAPRTRAGQLASGTSSLTGGQGWVGS